MGWSDLGLPVVPSVCVDAMFVPLILVCSLMNPMMCPSAPLHLMLLFALVGK